MSKFNEGDSVIIVKRHNGVPYKGTVRKVEEFRNADGTTSDHYHVMVDGRGVDRYIDTDMRAA